MTALDHLARLDAEATRGPWEREKFDFAERLWSKGKRSCVADTFCGHGNGELIASLRNALPAIIEALRHAEYMKRCIDYPAAEVSDFDAAMVALSAALGER